MASLHWVSRAFRPTPPTGHSGSLDAVPPPLAAGPVYALPPTTTASTEEPGGTLDPVECECMPRRRLKRIGDIKGYRQYDLATGNSLLSETLHLQDDVDSRPIPAEAELALSQVRSNPLEMPDETCSYNTFKELARHIKQDNRAIS